MVSIPICVALCHAFHFTTQSLQEQMWLTFISYFLHHVSFKIYTMVVSPTTVSISTARKRHSKQLRTKHIRRFSNLNDYTCIWYLKNIYIYIYILSVYIYHILKIHIIKHIPHNCKYPHFGSYSNSSIHVYPL